MNLPDKFLKCLHIKKIEMLVQNSYDGYIKEETTFPHLFKTTML